MKLAPSLILALLLASPCLGQAPPVDPLKPTITPQAVITAPGSVPAGSSIVLFGDKSSAVTLKWKLVSPKGAFLVFDQGGRSGVAAVVPGPVPPGVYKFALVATGTDPVAFDFDFAEVTVTDPAPVPVPPSPPPVPQPVDPTPVPPPTPSVVGNMRVVVLYESTQNMTRDQMAAMYSTKQLVPYLNAKCMKDSAGRASWRYWDKDTDVANEPAEWRDAMAKARIDAKPLPKVVVFSGNTVVDSRPITSEADTLAFLRSLGGN